MAVPAPRRLLAVLRDDLVDVEEAVALEADVDERGLHPGEDVVDDALVDVADDRSRALAFDVKLRYAELSVGTTTPRLLGFASATATV
jgi:hypothetical protein